MVETRGVAKVSAWLAVWLIAMDLGANLLFPFESVNEPGLRGQLANYFEHGRSTEARLRLAIQSAGDRSKAMLRAGWIVPETWSGQPATREPQQQHLVAIYGNSFARQIGQTLSKMHSTIGVRIVFGPVAPPSHSYATYLADRGHHDASVVVFGVVPNTIAGMLSMTRATQSVIEPFPYTYPRFQLDGGRLSLVEPVLGSVDDLRSALDDPGIWERHEQQLAQFDAFYSPAIFSASPLDRSTFAKLLRTAWAIRVHRTVEQSVHTRRGFEENSEALALLEALLRDFATSSVADGLRPVVLLMSIPPYGDDLDRFFRQNLRAAGVAVLHSQDTCPATIAANFSGDGHFSTSCAKAIANQLAQLIESLPPSVGKLDREPGH